MPPAAIWPPAMPAPSAMPAAAATYYLDVLKLDPRNPDLLSRTFLSVLTDGDIDEASKLAERLLDVDHTDRISRLVIGIRELKLKHYGQPPGRTLPSRCAVR